MAERTYKLLASHQGQQTAVNGATQIRAGMLMPLHGAKIGFNSRAEEQGRIGAVLGTATSDQTLQNVPWTTTTVFEGEALPAFGAVYRLLDVTATKVVLTMDDPAQTSGLFRRQDSLVVAARGQLGMSGAGGQGPMSYFELMKVIRDDSGRVVAVLETWKDLPRINVSPDEISTLLLAEGDALVTSRGSHRVLSVRPGDAERGLPPWVEIDSRPDPR